MIKYKTEAFDFKNEEVLWENFMCFVRSIIPYEEYWDDLSECQKNALRVFIYDADVLGEGHIGFMDLNSEYISFDDVIKAMEILHISDLYIENIKNIPAMQISIDSMVDESEDEEAFEAKMNELDELFDVFDNTYYELSRESTEIQDKILMYLQANIDEFFEFSVYV